MAETRVYKYKAKRPHEGADRVHEQARLAHSYRNALVEATREARTLEEDALRELCPGLAVLERRTEEAWEKLSSALDEEKRNRSRRGAEALETGQGASHVRHPDKDSAQTIRSLRAVHKEAQEALWAERRKARREDSWAPIRDQLRADHRARVRALRAEWSAAGLRHGTYTSIEDAVKRATKDRAKRGLTPKFVAWDARPGDRIGEQISGGLTVSELLSCTSTRARLVVTDRPRAKPESRRGATRKAAELWLRVGTQPPRRGPVWARVHLHYHRPLPENARIQRVYLVRRLVGTGEEWSVQFTIKLEPDTSDRAEEGAVGIDVGWRTREDGYLRVAVWSGSDGGEGEVALSPRWLEGMRRCERIRAHRDELFDEIRNELRSWLADLVERRGEEASPWLVRLSRGASRSRSSPRYAKALTRLLTVDNEELPEALEAWRARERHLHDYEAHMRRQLLEHRRALYADVAAGLSRRYHRVVTEKIRLDTLARRPDLASPVGAEDDAMRLRRTDAAVHELLEALRQRHAEEVRVVADQTTQTCSACGAETDPGRNLVWACTACGCEWDRDVNAARNILALGHEASAGLTKHVRPPVDPSTRWTYDPGGRWYARHDGGRTTRTTAGQAT